MNKEITVPPYTLMTV